uniref:Uncharacterized protein n=1 Tax=Arundo donax TaxID=35708 RepID=A0A0A9H2E8_ARUDO
MNSDSDILDVYVIFHFLWNWKEKKGKKLAHIKLLVAGIQDAVSSTSKFTGHIAFKI